jgi:hypothetical protein
MWCTARCTGAAGRVRPAEGASNLWNLKLAAGYGITQAAARRGAGRRLPLRRRRRGRRAAASPTPFPSPACADVPVEITESITRW